MKKRKCDGNISPLFKSGVFSIKTRNGRLFRYYMMVRSLGRPRLGGKILYTDILHFCHQTTFITVFSSESCISAGHFDNTALVLVLGG